MSEESENPGFSDQRVASLAAEMRAHGTTRERPVRTVLAFLGDRWSTLILLVLATGEWRHAELKRVMASLIEEPPISQRVLTLKLRALERDGFVSRTVSVDVPPKVSYRLTGPGEALHRLARSIIDWTSENSNAIEEARLRFDAD